VNRCEAKIKFSQVARVLNTRRIGTTFRPFPLKTLPELDYSSLGSKFVIVSSLLQHHDTIPCL